LGCRFLADSTPAAFVEGTNEQKYERVFGDSPPSNLTIVNAAVVAYGWRPGINTTDDWEFEILAPRPWIDAQIAELHLREASQHLLESCFERRKSEALEWYAPKTLGDYDAYYLYGASIPYVHLLVDRETLPDNRFRIFLSKH
jgi:hypothetical protein